MPKDVAKNLHKPTNVMSDKDRTQQTTHPTLDKKTLEQLEAMRRAGAPEPPAAAPAPQPQQQQAAPQQAQQQPLPPAPQPQPQQQAMVEAPRPAQQQPSPRVNFGTQGQSAGEALRQAAQAAAQTRGQNGNFGQGLPVVARRDEYRRRYSLGYAGSRLRALSARILSDIKRNWEPLIPEEARPPLNKQGDTLIRFVINADGSIGAMHLDDSTHDDAINRACWSAITSEGVFPPLPKEFKGPNLELRIHFLTNKPLP